MREHHWFMRLIAVCCTIALLLSFPFTPVSAAEAETGNRITATTGAAIKQGNTGYCYVYIDSLESLFSLDVTVYFDPATVRVTSSYNQVTTAMYDSSVKEDHVQYTYLFDGEGNNEQTQLFYFEYQVLSDAPLGESFFDVVVGEAYDKDLQLVPLSGSRCSFQVQQTLTNLSCSISGTSSVSTTVEQEFTLSYRFSKTAIASGSFVIRYDPELFALESLTQGDFLTDKMTDVNTALSGAIYVSFLGSTYGDSRQLLTLKFKTLKNVTQTAPITLAVTDLYDLNLNPISCGGYTTNVQLNKDLTYDEDAAAMWLETAYDQQSGQLQLTVQLEAGAKLGAGDFVLTFNTQRYTYLSAQKEFSPNFFNINDKEVEKGILKFSIISFTDIVDATKVLTVQFSADAPCEDTPAAFDISGSGITDSLTNAVVVNFRGCTAAEPGHTPVTDAAALPTCLETGLTEGSHCRVCQKILVAQETIPALGHDEIPHESLAPTCTEIGWEAYNTCSRCEYTTYVEIPANGHTFQKGVCIICGADQDPGMTWDVSTAADGSLMAKLYLNADGTYDLQLTGSGPMKSWGVSSYRPWYSYREKITGLRLPDGLTTIGDYAFYGFTALTEITLPESLESLGYMAFYQCTKLQQINFNAVAMNDMTEGNHVFSYCGQETDGITLRIGADVEKIPAYLFLPDTRSSYKPKLTAVEFEAGGNCLEIGRMAFYQCRDISRLQLPESLQSIGYYAFGYCSGLESLQLPESLQTIGSSAFYGCTGLTELTLPESLQTIGSSVFYGCTGLEYLNLPESLQTIEDYAFSGCTGLNSLHLPEGLQTIDYYAFGGCTGLESLTLPENLQTIGKYAFYNCTGLTKIHYNARSLADLDSYNYVFSYAGQNGDGITVTVGSSVTKIPAYLFYPYSSSDYAPKIVAVEFAENSSCVSIGSRAFYEVTTLKSILLPRSVTNVGSYAFYNTDRLTVGFESTELPTLGSNWKNDLRYYLNVKEFVNYGDALYTVLNSGSAVLTGYYGNETFYAVEAAVGGVPVTKVGYSAFRYNTALTEIALPAGLTAIDTYAFSGCTALTELTLPESLQTIGNSAFSGCTALTEIRLNAVQMTDLSYQNGVFTNAGQAGEGITLTVGKQVTRIPAYLCYPGTGADNTPKITRVVFEEGSVCQSIGSTAFAHNRSLLEAKIPATVNRIEDTAFGYCINLILLFESDTLPETLGSGWATEVVYYLGAPRIVTVGDARYTVIGEAYAVLSRYDGSEDTFRVEDQVEGIPVTGVGSRVFWGKTMLTAVTLPENLQHIGSEAFSGCSGLTGLALPESLQTIGEKAFYNCSGLTELTLPESLQTIGENAFSGCTGLTELTLPESLQTIGSYAFYGCRGLTKISFNAVNLADLSDSNYVFAYCGQNGDGITVSVGSGVTRIPAYLFYPYSSSGYTPKITVVEFAENSACQSVGSFAFYNCTALTELQLPESLLTIEDSAFRICTGLTELTLPEGLTTLGDYAFCGCSGLRELALPESLQTIGSHAFYGSTGLTEIHYNCAELDSFDYSNYVFAYCGNASDGITVTVGSGVKTLPDNLFRPDRYNNAYISKILAVEFAENSSCVSIGSDAFYNCTALTDLQLPESLQTIGSYAFYNCTGLTELQLPESLRTIGSHAFYGCTALTEIDLPKNLQGIESNTFTNCSALVKVSLPESLTTLGNRAFYDCTGLTEITLPDSLQSIDAYAFCGCTALKKVNLPESLTSIGLFAFGSCDNLIQIDFNATNLPDLSSSNYVFSYCGSKGNGITVTIGSNVTRIPAYLFYPYNGSNYIPKITAVEFEEGSQCRDIGSYAFYKCTTLRGIRLPLSVTSVRYNAFGGCSGLKTVFVPSASVVSSISNTGLSGNAQTLILPATASFSSSRFTYVERITLDGTAYKVYSTSAHQWEEYQVLIPYIHCQQDGLVRYYCAHCDTYQDISQVKHTPDAYAAREPDCVNVGWYAYEACPDCDYTTYVEIPALGHIVQIQNTSGAGLYTVKNSATYPFSFDGTTYKSTNKKDSSSASFVVTAVQACTLELTYKISSEQNYDWLYVYHNGVQFTKNSGEIDWKTLTIKLTAGDTVKITYSKDGSAYRGEDTAYFRLTAMMIVPAEQAEPDCVNPMVCFRCNTELKPALGHILSSHEAKTVTCTEIGWDAYETCSRCDYSTYQEIPALGHDAIHHEAQAVTCLAIGWDAYESCSRCDYSTYAEIPALGHVLSSHEAKAVTCVAIGWDAYETCSHCDYSTYQEISALGHSFVETFCTVCGVKQTPLYTWDASAADDGSLLAKLYQNYAEGGYELEFTGSGNMKDYSYYSTNVAPWCDYSYMKKINRVSLPEGLTYIGSYAFYHNTALRQIWIPDSVERIADNAFSEAEKLVVLCEGDIMPPVGSYNYCGFYLDPQKVILEANATYVIDRNGNAVLAKYVGGEKEFVARETVDGIPVTKIGAYAFYNRSRLKFYWIPEEIQAIGERAFYECGGVALLVESDQLPASCGKNWYGTCDYYVGATVWTENGLLFVRDIRDRVDLVCYQGSESDITVPAQPGGYPLTRIRGYSFAESSVKRVVLSEGIQSIGAYAFYDSQLQEIKLPESLVEIGDSGFNDCSALREIKLPENLQKIGYQAFWYCSSLKEVTIPDKITQLNSATFVTCSSLEKVTLPEGLHQVGHMEFYCCTSLKEIELPANLHAVGSSCFSGCSALKVVYVRSPKLAATLTDASAAENLILKAVTAVVPAGTGTDYLKNTYPYCETRQRNGVAVDVYSKCAHNWQTEKVSEYTKCRSDGYEVHTCSLCGVWTDDFTPKHAMETTVFAPTCTVDGYTLQTCADCGATERTDPVAKLGHERNYGGILCNRCGETACLMAVKNGDSLFGCDSWQEAMNEAWRGNTLVLYADITGDVSMYQSMRLDLNGHSIRGTLTVAEGATLRGIDSTTDDFAGSYGSITAVNGNFLTDATSIDGKRYIALTDGTGVSFHRMQLQLHTVTLRTAKAGLYYKASLECDEALRNAITRHGVALSVAQMPGVDFKADGRYTWIDGAPVGDFTSGSVFNILRSELTPEENAARGAMMIYANAYVQLADGTILMSDTTTGDKAADPDFDGIAYSLFDVLQLLDEQYAQLAPEAQSSAAAFYAAWKEKGMQDLQLENIGTET